MIRVDWDARSSEQWKIADADYEAVCAALTVYEHSSPLRLASVSLKPRSNQPGQLPRGPSQERRSPPKAIAAYRT